MIENGLLTESRRIKISKFLSLVLRHKPEAIGIVLDGAGWTDVEGLLEAAACGGVSFTMEELLEVVATNDKKRFAFNEDESRIRASQGHSVEVELGLAAVVPPEVLFHGTATRFLEGIRKEGLKRMSRRHVHLSAEEATATKVGARHGKVVVLRVRAGEMHRTGKAFYVSANGVWLTEGVGVEWLEF
ncbi:MAG TPA: RNA 2'-phosphotransferase [Phycisphaerae bacterium]|jgi:putative RNA 2'-phosphotransferase